MFPCSPVCTCVGVSVSNLEVRKTNLVSHLLHSKFVFVALIASFSIKSYGNFGYCWMFKSTAVWNPPVCHRLLVFFSKLAFISDEGNLHPKFWSEPELQRCQFFTMCFGAYWYMSMGQRTRNAGQIFWDPDCLTHKSIDCSKPTRSEGLRNMGVKRVLVQ